MFLSLNVTRFWHSFTPEINRTWHFGLLPQQYTCSYWYISKDFWYFMVQNNSVPTAMLICAVQCLIWGGNILGVKCDKVVNFPKSVTNLSSLQSRRTQTKLIALYKIINGLLTVPTHDLVPKSPSLRSGYHQQPMTLINAYKYSFFSSTLKL